MDRVLRRACAIGAGLVMGLACGILAATVGSLVRIVGTAGSAPVDPESLFIAVVEAIGLAQIGSSGFVALWSDILVRCCVPLVLIALVGEAARLRSLVYYAGGSMVLSVLISRVGQAATALNSWDKTALVAAGVSGLVYWGVAGRETAEGPKGDQMSRFA